MYFIIEGQAAVLNGKKVIALFKKCDYFGEMSIISGKASLRNVKILLL